MTSIHQFDLIFVFTLLTIQIPVYQPIHFSAATQHIRRGQISILILQKLVQLIHTFSQKHLQAYRDAFPLLPPGNSIISSMEQYINATECKLFVTKNALWIQQYAPYVFALLWPAHQHGHSPSQTIHHLQIQFYLAYRKAPN